MSSKVSGSVDSKGERLKTSIAAAFPTNGVSYGQMSNLVASVVTNLEPMTKLSTLPTIKTRTKKLVQEELAKRARKMEQVVVLVCCHTAKTGQEHWPHLSS
jgi:adenylate kinase